MKSKWIWMLLIVVLLFTFKIANAQQSEVPNSLPFWFLEYVDKGGYWDFAEGESVETVYFMSLKEITSFLKDAQIPPDNIVRLMKVLTWDRQSIKYIEKEVTVTERKVLLYNYQIGSAAQLETKVVTGVDKTKSEEAKPAPKDESKSKDDQPIIEDLIKDKKSGGN